MGPIAHTESSKREQRGELLPKGIYQARINLSAFLSSTYCLVHNHDIPIKPMDCKRYLHLPQIKCGSCSWFFSSRYLHCIFIVCCSFFLLFSLAHHRIFIISNTQKSLFTCIQTLISWFYTEVFFIENIIKCFVLSLFLLSLMSLGYALFTFICFPALPWLSVLPSLLNSTCWKKKHQELLYLKTFQF